MVIGPVTIEHILLRGLNVVGLFIGPAMMGKQTYVLVYAKRPLFLSRVAMWLPH